MSRHTMEAPGVEVVVGWDPPLRTYFAQVWDRTVDEDDPAAELLWVGFALNEVRDPEHVRDLVAPWVTVPAETLQALAADRMGGC